MTVQGSHDTAAETARHVSNLRARVLHIQVLVVCDLVCAVGDQEVSQDLQSPFNDLVRRPSSAVPNIPP